VFQTNNNMMGLAANSEEPNDNNTNNNDDTSKWESLYNNYQPQSADPILPPSSPPNAAPQPHPTSTSKSEIKIITFDLDNTLWKTSETITHANTVLFEQLQAKFGIEVRSEVEMGKLFREFPDRYCGLLDETSEIGGSSSGGDDNNGSGAMDDAEYANSVENVGRSDTVVMSSSPPSKDDDDGVHIQTTQASGTSKKKKKPVYLTLLRKDAIRSLILQQQQQLTNDDLSLLSPLELEQEVDTAFQLWMEARSQSISQNFAPFALETLAQLKSSLISPTATVTTTTTAPNDANQSNKKVYIGAITDGNSNPQSVPELSGLFDFVIKAEDVGVSKPDKRVYKAAVAELMVQLMRDGRSVEEFFLGDEFGGDVATDASYLMSSDDGSSSIPEQPSWKDVDPDAVDAFSEAVGPWWVHIGDDFFKDIVAAKEFRMRSVWMRELIGGAKAFGGVDEEASPGTTAKKRSVEDLVNDIAKNNGAITMAIGDSDFLTSALHEEFSDAILDRFADLSDLLVQWNEEGKGNEGDYGNEAVTYPDTEPILSEAYTVTTPSVAPSLQSDESESVPTKFCFACGEKIPAVAKFCPGCGERQSLS
jgi:FMN phosphatase YigB (HAD superfamily)